MRLALLSLLGFVILTILLVAAIGSWRVFLVFSGKAKANDFKGGVAHGSERYWRLNRAHINAAENLPILATLVFLGVYQEIGTPWFDYIAFSILIFRLLQTYFLVFCFSNIIANVRFVSFSLQILGYGALVLMIAVNYLNY